MKSITIILSILAITIILSGLNIFNSYAQPQPTHYEVTIYNGCNKITYKNCSQATTDHNGTYLIDEHNKKHWFSTSVQAQVTQVP